MSHKVFPNNKQFIQFKELIADKSTFATVIIGTERLEQLEIIARLKKTNVEELILEDLDSLIMLYQEKLESIDLKL